MPLYEYRCEECGRLSEFFVRKAGESPDRSVLVCEYCGSSRLERALSTVAVRSTGGVFACSTGMCSLDQGRRD